MFDEYGRETGYDEEPEPTAIPIPKEENKKTKDMRRFYFLYETDKGSDTISFVAQYLSDAYKMFEEKLGKPEPQIIDVHSEPIK